MDYVILDLEWNSGFCKKKQKYINEIIEFGAVRLDENMNETEEFSMLVRPVVTKRLNSTVKRLTAIKDSELKSGVNFNYALSKFRRFLGNSVLMSWSSSDISTLETNCEYFLGSSKLDFIDKYADLQAYCQDMLGLTEENSLSLMAAAQQMSVDTDAYKHHRAVDDCRIAAECLRKIYLRQAMMCYIRSGSELSAEKNSTRSYVSADEMFADIGNVHFNCRYCGRRCRRRRKWEWKNRYFVSEFECSVCENKFFGRVSYKLKDDNIIVNKRICSDDTNN